MDVEQTTQVFNRIADAWYNVRHYTIFRDELEELAQQWGTGKLLNAGCGHGADFLPFVENGDFELHGVDIAEEMIENAETFAEKHGFDAALHAADMRNLPYSIETFDYFICIAALHHLPQHADRITALKELFYTLKRGGKGCITVFNRRHPKFWFHGKETELPWENKGEGHVHRYYYLYTRSALKNDLEEAGFTVNKITGEKDFNGPDYFARNIIAHVRRPA